MGAFHECKKYYKDGEGGCEKYIEWINIFPTTKSIHIDKYIYVFVYPYSKNSFLFFSFIYLKPYRAGKFFSLPYVKGGGVIEIVSCLDRRNS